MPKKTKGENEMKRKTFLRTLCALLALLMTFAVFASCAKDEVDGEEDTSGEVTTAAPTGGDDTVEVDYRTLLPNAYYDNADFNILLTDGRQGRYEFVGDDLSEATLLQRALYERNTYVEETYGVVFEFIYPSGGDSAFNSAVAADVASGNCEYDVVMPDYYYGVETKGYLENLNKYDAFNFDNPYWVSGWNDKAEVNGIMYSAVGYMNIDIMTNAMGVFCNEYVALDLGISEQIRESVISGDWTLETMTEYMKQYTVDAGNDGIYNFEDSYGLGYNLWSGRAFLYGCGLEMTSFENGTVSINIMSDKNSKIFDEVKTFLYRDNLSYYGGRSGWDAFDGPEGDTKLFLAGRALFESYCVSYGETIAKTFERFSIYPMPKLDVELQEDYITPNMGTCVQGILKGVKNAEMSATILEALNILSYLDCRPVYYEQVLKTRLQSSEEGAEIMEVIISNISVTFEFVNTASFGMLADRAFDAIDPSGYDASVAGKGYFSAMGSIEKSAKIQLENFLERYTEEAAE